MVFTSRSFKRITRKIRHKTKNRSAKQKKHLSAKKKHLSANRSNKKSHTHRINRKKHKQIGGTTYDRSINEHATLANPLKDD